MSWIRRDEAQFDFRPSLLDLRHLRRDRVRPSCLLPEGGRVRSGRDVGFGRSVGARVAVSSLGAGPRPSPAAFGTLLQIPPLTDDPWTSYCTGTDSGPAGARWVLPEGRIPGWRGLRHRPRPVPTPDPESSDPIPVEALGEKHYYKT